MTQDALHAHIRNPENYTAVRDLASGQWLGHAYRTVAGHFRAVRFFDVGLSDGPYARVEDAIEAVYLSWHNPIGRYDLEGFSFRGPRARP